MGVGGLGVRVFMVLGGQGVSWGLGVLGFRCQDS